MKSNWNFLNIVAKEKSLISEYEEEILSDKQTAIKRANWASKFINFINSKSDEELEDIGIKDRYFYAVEVNKMIIRNDLWKVT